MTRRVRTTTLAMTAALGAVAFGCAERRIFVTSEPEGATVIINDVNVGQTPVEVDFLFYGVYDVRLTKDGYEPILTSERIKAPLWDWPGFDVVAAAIPGKEKKHVAWHFELTATETDPDALIARAATLRTQLAGSGSSASPAEQTPRGEPIVVDELSGTETSTEELPPVVPEPPAEEGGGDQDDAG